MNSLKKIGLFSTEEALRLGVSKATLYRLVQDEQINKVGSGLFSHPNINLSGTELDYAIACRTLGPHSVVGGLTALAHYQLTEQVLQQIWVLVPPSKRGWNSMYRCLRTSIPLDIEIENRKLYRIVNIERALIEGLRYATKIGLETALTAIRTALREKKTKMSRLETAAKNLNLKSIIVKHWEAIIS